MNAKGGGEKMKSTRSTMKVANETKILMDKIKRTLTDVYGVQFARIGIVRLTDEEVIRMMAWMLRKSVGVDQLEALAGTRLENVFTPGGKPHEPD